MSASNSSSSRRINKVSLDRKILEFTLSLYNNPYLARNAIDFIIESFDTFITDSMIPFIHNQIDEELKPYANEQSYYKAKFILEKNKNLFRKYSTEHLRFKIYEQESLYVPPQLVDIGQTPHFVYDGHEVHVEMKNVSAAYISLPRTLQKNLQVPGLYNQMVDYRKQLMENDQLLCNFIQGDLWKRKYAAIREKKNVFPIFLYYDEFEAGNPLGSHAGEQKLGGVYISLPSLPPHLVSKVENLFVSLIFHSKYLKEFGNKPIFEKAIEDLNNLSTNGITINVNNCEETVYFQCVLILGDNLGINCICGFSQSFSANLYCRICTASKIECQNMVSEYKSKIRTRDLYDKTAFLDAANLTGIREVCVFNDIDNFHIAENMAVDIMHDFSEGVAVYTIGKILERLISEGVISLSELNNKIDMFPYEENEATNKPRPLFYSTEAKKRGLEVKQSASEMLCLARYLGFIIGDLVPADKIYWKLYVCIREILGIITSPTITSGDIGKLEELMEKHNRLYLLHFGALKPKMHIWLHYTRLILLNGPVIHYSTSMFERKNKKLKEAAVAISRSINLPYTIAIRHQLQLCYTKEFCPIIMRDVILGPFSKDNARSKIKRFLPNFDENAVVKNLQYVEILGYKYSPGAIIVITITQEFPIFGEIKQIYFCSNDADESIYFELEKFDTLEKVQYYSAYKLDTDINNSTIIMNVELVPRIPPSTLMAKQTGTFVIGKYDV